MSRRSNDHVNTMDDCAKTTPASPPCWSALQPELADLVLRRLPSHSDRVRFASVCRHWHHTAVHYSRPSLPPPLPWLSFSDDGGTLFQSLPDRELHSICRSDHELLSPHCRGSFGIWLLFDGENAAACSTLVNPLTGATLRLPVPKTCNKDVTIKKVIVCSGELIAVTCGYYKGPDKVMCCRPGASSSWSMDRHWYVRGYHDMAFYKGDIYTVSTWGCLSVHEVTMDSHTGEPKVSRTDDVIREPDPVWQMTFCMNFDTRNYLVVSCVTHKLLLVQWIAHRDAGSLDDDGPVCIVLKAADFEKNRWVKVENLGDEVLFVSSDCSRAIRASDHGGYLQGNRVYLVHEKPKDSRPVGPTDPCIYVVYDLSKQSHRTVSLGQLRSHGPSRAAWFFP